MSLTYLGHGGLVVRQIRSRENCVKIGALTQGSIFCSNFGGDNLQQLTSQMYTLN